MHELSPYNMDRTISIHGEVKGISEAEQQITEKLRQFEVPSSHSFLLLNVTLPRLTWQQCPSKASILDWTRNKCKCFLAYKVQQLLLLTTYLIKVLTFSRTYLNQFFFQAILQAITLKKQWLFLFRLERLELLLDQEERIFEISQESLEQAFEFM